MAKNLTDSFIQVQWVEGGNYTSGEAIDIKTDNTVNVKYDNKTIVLNEDGELESACCETQLEKVCTTDRTPEYEWEMVIEDCGDNKWKTYEAVMSMSIPSWTPYIQVDSAVNSWKSNNFNTEKWYNLGKTKTFEVITIDIGNYPSTIHYTSYAFPTSVYSLEDKHMFENIAGNRWKLMTNITHMNGQYLHTGDYPIATMLVQLWESDMTNSYKNYCTSSTGSYWWWIGIWTILTDSSWMPSTAQMQEFSSKYEVYWRATYQQKNSWFLWDKENSVWFWSSYSSWDCSTWDRYVGIFGKETITLNWYTNLMWYTIYYIDAKRWTKSHNYRTLYMEDPEGNFVGVWSMYPYDRSSSYSPYTYFKSAVQSKDIEWQLIWKQITSEAALITFNWSPSGLDATNVQSAVDEVAKKYKTVEDRIKELEARVAALEVLHA